MPLEKLTEADETTEELDFETDEEARVEVDVFVVEIEVVLCEVVVGFGVLWVLVVVGATCLTLVVLGGGFESPPSPKSHVAP
jgi:hypothetical protein